MTLGEGGKKAAPEHLQKHLPWLAEIPAKDVQREFVGIVGLVVRAQTIFRLDLRMQRESPVSWI